MTARLSTLSHDDAHFPSLPHRSGSPLPKEFFIGLDLGGTAIKAGVCDSDGNIIGQAEIPTGKGAETIVANMEKAGRMAAEDAKIDWHLIKAVGAVSPGILDIPNGVVLRAANLDFHDFPLRDRLSVAFGKPAVIENDANAAGYGELWAGAGRHHPGLEDICMITLGTGVGGAVITTGKVQHGLNSFAGEIGHTIAVLDGEQCGCGQKGCLELYCSAINLAKRCQAYLESNPDEPSLLHEKLKSKGSIESLDIYLACKDGDAIALKFWKETARFVALACVNLVRTLDPQLIVIAGGLSKAGDFLLSAIQKEFNDLHWTLLPPNTPIRIAELGANAGLVGAAGVAKKATSKISFYI